MMMEMKMEMEMEIEKKGEEELAELGKLSGYREKVRMVKEGAEETMVLWGIQQPTVWKQNALVAQTSLQLKVEACGHSLSIHQSPSSYSTSSTTTTTTTGSVIWDSALVLAKFLEHAVHSKSLFLQQKKLIELGAGCGLLGCVAALLGAQVFLTDLPDRLKLLRKNVETNLNLNLNLDSRGRGASASALVNVLELTWGDHPHPQLLQPIPDYVVGSDVIYSESAVADLLDTLVQLCGPQTTVFLAAELRNDSILEYFLDAALKDFVIGRIDQKHWHPDCRSPRVVMYILVKK